MILRLELPHKEFQFLANMQKLINADKTETEKPLTLEQVALECIRMAMDMGAKMNEIQQE